MSPLASALESAQRFARAIGARDWDALSNCLAPQVTFRALVPSTNPFRERRGPADTVDQLRTWFQGGEPHQLLEHQTTEVQDCVHVRYRIRHREAGAWEIVEQQAYLEVGAEGITSVNLLCSGFRPAAPPP